VNPFYNALPVFAQNWAWTLAGWRRSRSLYPRIFQRTLEQWESTIDDSLEQQHARQWEHLKVLLDRARQHVPYYRFLPPVVETSDPLESIGRTLAEIPPLEKSVYRARPRDFRFSDIPAVKLTEFSTSGTTGTALPVWHTSERMAEYDAAVWRMYRAFGVDLRDPWIQFGGRPIVPIRQHKPPFWRVDSRERRTLFSIFHMSPENLPTYVDAIHAAPARFVQGYPSALHLMSRALLAAGRPIPAGQLAAVFTSSETLLDHQRQTIEEAFNAPVRDHYASTERAVSMTGCSERRLHVDLEFGLVEVEATEETADHTRGQLLVTGLGNPATVFVRYRIGEIGTRARTPCPCGRPGDSFIDIDGRIEDYVLTPDGRLIGRLDHVFKEQYAVEEAQICQAESGALTISMVATDDFDDAARRRLLRALRERLGSEMTIEIRRVDAIPREPNGKFRAVISEIKRAQT
jgi:phenylacetate-CoA ligase